MLSFHSNRISCESDALSPSLLAVVIVGAAVTLAVQLRKAAPPEPARLLPGADAFLYANFSWVRKSTSETVLPSVSHDPEYEQFIQETGFDFERDLDAVAFAVHYPQSWPGGGTGDRHPSRAFLKSSSAVSTAGGCAAYMRRMAQSVENYNSVDILYDSDLRANLPRRDSGSGYGRGFESRGSRRDPRHR